MPVERHLGAAWVSVHGPVEPGALATWVLDQGFSGIVPGPSPRPRDWPALKRVCDELPATVPAVRQADVFDSDRLPPAGMASTRPGEIEACRSAVAGAVALARRCGTARVVLEPGTVPLTGEPISADLGDPAVRWDGDRASAVLARRRPGFEPAVERVCRFLFDRLREFDDVTFCLTPGRSLATVGDREGLELILGDLRDRRLTWWHDTAVVARRGQLTGEESGAWLEAFSNRLSGITLGDTSDGGLYHLPGSGGVDYPQLATYVLRSGPPLPVVLEPEPGVDPGEIPGVHAFLGRFGL